MNRLMNRRVIPLSLMLLAACADERADVPIAQPDATAPSGHHFTVDSTTYTLRSDSAALTASIGYAFRNPVADTVYVVNCNGHVVMDLQKRAADGWESVWHGMTNACLSPALEIAPGETMAGRIEIWGALPGDPSLPTFTTDQLNGEFRLVWHQVRLRYDADTANFGDTLSVAQRSTTPFQLRMPARDS